jgi:MFS family permease
MTTDAAAVPGAGGDSRPARGGERGREYRAITVVSAAHFVQHFQGLVLPPLFPFLTAQLGIGFVELGFALTIASTLSVAAQLPVGFLVDKLGSRWMLIAGLALSALAFIAFGLSPSYSSLLLAMGLVGLSSSVFHPADYAVLTAQVATARVGRAFSIHTFAGFLGNAVAPVTMLAIAASFGLKAAMFATGAVALVAALPLLLVRGIDNRSPAMHAGSPTGARLGLLAILTLVGFSVLVKNLLGLNDPGG